MTEDRETALARLVEDNPDDVDAYRAYGDHLEELGDPRGKLMGMQILRGTLADRVKREHLEARLEAFFEEHREHFLGPLAKVMPGPSASRQRRANAPQLEWRYGFIYKAELKRLARPKMHVFLDRLLAHPSGRFLVELDGAWAEEPAALFAVLAARSPRSLRRITISGSDGRSRFGIDELWPRFELLEELVVSGTSSLGEIVVPNLRKAVVEISDSHASQLRSLAKAHWPKLEGLLLRIRSDEVAASEILAVLDRELPALRSLQLDLAATLPEVLLALSRLPLGRQLAVLELGSTSSEILAALEQCTFQLEELHIQNTYPDPRPRLAHLAKRIEFVRF